MNKISKESSEKLQKILSKKLGRNLTDLELEDAYDKLLSFSFSLVLLNIKSNDKVIN